MNLFGAIIYAARVTCHVPCSSLPTDAFLDSREMGALHIRCCGRQPPDLPHCCCERSLGPLPGTSCVFPLRTWHRPLVYSIDLIEMIHRLQIVTVSRIYGQLWECYTQWLCCRRPDIRDTPKLAHQRTGRTGVEVNVKHEQPMQSHEMQITCHTDARGMPWVPWVDFRTSGIYTTPLPKSTFEATIRWVSMRLPYHTSRRINNFSYSKTAEKSEPGHMERQILKLCTAERDRYHC